MSWEPVPRMPRTRQVSSTLTPLARKREREMQHGRTALGIVPHGTGDEYVTDWNAAGKDLACGDMPAAGDAFSLAGPRNPVRAAAADKHEFSAATLRSSVSSAPDRGASATRPLPPDACASTGRARSNRNSGRGRAASRRARLLGTTATEFRGNAGGEYALLL